MTQLWVRVRGLRPLHRLVDDRQLDLFEHRTVCGKRLPKVGAKILRQTPRKLGRCVRCDQRNKGERR